MNSLAYLVIIVVMFVWIMHNNKKNQKQAAQMQSSLKPGMYVMLKDGLFGTIVDVLEKDVVINFSVDGADEGCLTVGKDSIYNIVEQAEGDAIAPANGQTSAAEQTAAPGSIAERLQHAAAVEAAEEAAEEAEDSDDSAFEGNGSEEAAEDMTEGGEAAESTEEKKEEGPSEEPQTEEVHE